jgi:hypothetical protein
LIAPELSTNKALNLATIRTMVPLRNRRSETQRSGHHLRKRQSPLLEKADGATLNTIVFAQKKVRENRPSKPATVQASYMMAPYE